MSALRAPAAVRAAELMLLVADQQLDDATEVAPTDGVAIRFSELARPGDDPDDDVAADLLPDPSPGPVAACVARETLERWAASPWTPRLPARLRPIGVGLVGWQLSTEGAHLLGLSCPVCADRPRGWSYCLACQAAAPLVERVLRLIAEQDRPRPPKKAVGLALRRFGVDDA